MREGLRREIEAAYSRAQYSWTECDWTEPDATEAFLKQVEKDAAEAEDLAEEAIEWFRAGDLYLARNFISSASSIELTYGDDPTWGPLRRLIEKAYEEESEGGSR